MIACKTWEGMKPRERDELVDRVRSLNRLMGEGSWVPLREFAEDCGLIAVRKRAGWAYFVGFREDDWRLIRGTDGTILATVEVDSDTALATTIREAK